MAEQGVGNFVEWMMEMSCNLRQVSFGRTLDELLADGGGILTAEEGNAGSFAGLLRGVKAGLGVELVAGRGSKLKRVVLSGNPILGVQGSG